MKQNNIQALALPNLHIKEINTKARESNLEKPNILKWIWDTVTSLILDAL